ncbi:hypothetical protein [Streptomyces sp. NBC_00690]|uniref:hypothetical protein n=1 Tax=Streptomyces sp. NBC_00690 TaxID=2975808 RepID=UPI002E2A75E9|nr:hypothetical protein [Streptomyces sp. NBC_00690]
MTAFRRTSVAVLLASCVLAQGCSAGGKPPPVGGTKDPVPHGHVEGAQEASEQQSRLVMADAAKGTVRVLDLITEAVTPVRRAGQVQGITTDGRFAYLTTGTTTEIVDGGAWMVDHGDHVHYYRAPIRPVGEIRAPGPVRVHADPGITALSFGDGTVRLLDRKALEAGRPGAGRPLPEATAAPVVPYREHLVVPGVGVDRDRVEIHNRNGDRVSSLGATCPEPLGTALTRRGVVVGCAGGALLVAGSNGAFQAQKIPYGTAVAPAERAVEFRHRPGSTTLTARAGPAAAWVLDVTERTWKRITTGPIVAVNTAGEGTPLLTLGTDGHLSAFDPTTGERTARTPLLSPMSAGRTPAPVIEVDTQRAYVNDPVGRKVHEIDFNDRLRKARTFSLDFTPTHMVETGR